MGVSGIVNEFYLCLALNMMEDNPEASYFSIDVTFNFLF